MASARHIPSIDALLKRDALMDAIAREGPARVTAALRAAADQFRQRPEPMDGEAVARWIEQAALSRLAAEAVPSLRRVINATGVILHTNLGPRRWRKSRSIESAMLPPATPISNTTLAPARADIATFTLNRVSSRSPAPRPRSSSTTTPPRPCSCWRRTPPAAR